MSASELSMREKAWISLRGELPPQLPFITRLEAWFRSHQRTNTLPPAYQGFSLNDLHRKTGIGQLKFVNAYAFRLRGVELKVNFNGTLTYHQTDPVIENFPSLWDVVPTTQAGETEVEIITRRGILRLRHGLLEEHVRCGLDPYLQKHLIDSVEDFSIAQNLIEQMEFVPLFNRVKEAYDEVGENGLVVPLLQRIPFQQVLLEYLGEINTFKQLHYERKRVESLLQQLDEQLLDILPKLSPLAAATPEGVPYVEFPDNLHGMMTSPPLFRQYCLPAYQKYTDILHTQGKKVGSHTDGDMRPLLHLLAECGLDVCESFSQQPLTSCSMEEALRVFQNGPMIWGGIPSPWLEENVSQAEFEANIEQLLSIIERPFILGIVDLFMYHNSIERASYISRRIGCKIVPSKEYAPKGR